MMMLNLSLICLLLLIIHEIDKVYVSCVEINSFELPNCHKHLFDCEENIFDKSIKNLENKKVLFIGLSLIHI